MSNEPEQRTPEEQKIVDMVTNWVNWAFHIVVTILGFGVGWAIGRIFKPQVIAVDAGYYTSPILWIGAFILFIAGILFLYKRVMGRKPPAEEMLYEHVFEKQYTWADVIQNVGIFLRIIAGYAS